MRKVVFLDRDGTINVDHTYVHQQKDWEWIEGALEGMKKLQGAGYTLAIVTNQSGVGHGKYTHDHVATLHDYMVSEMKKQGLTLPAIAYCHHHRESGCDCRKPAPGMAKTIEADVGEIDYPNSWMIGDKPSDVGFGTALGMHTALIRSQYWNEDELEVKPDLVVDSLIEAARIITNET